MHACHRVCSAYPPVVIRWLASAFVTLCLAPLGLVHADAAHAVEAQLGLGSLSLRDDVLVSYAFTGPATVLGARYRSSWDSHAVEVGLKVAFGVLFTREGELGADAAHELYARSSHRVLDAARRTLRVGPSLRYAHDLAYLAEWDDAHGYWLATLMFGAHGEHRERLSVRHDLELGLELGLLGLSSRPPARRLNKQDALNHPSFYFNRFGADPDFASLADTLQLRLSALVRLVRPGRAIGAGWGVGYESRLSWAHDPAPIAIWYNGLLASYVWSSR